MILKQNVHQKTNKLLNAVESPVMEVGCDILQLPISQSSIQDEVFMTCRPDEWVFMARDKETVHQLHPNCEDVKLSGNINKHVKRQKHKKTGV